MKHAFVICAYKKSKYLERCVRSLINQTVASQIAICTSTPNKYIEYIADKYNLHLFIRKGTSDIQKDWNYACEVLDVDWVTVAHQDDIYEKHYFEEVRKVILNSPDGIMAFTDYRPIINDHLAIDINCRIRHILRTPMKYKCLSGNRFFKRYFLSVGNAICCPSVCYNRKLIGDPIFTSKLKFSLDWDTYVKLAEMDGRFIYIDKPLTYYRIHDKATTAEFINNRTRSFDDEYMFRQFWPEWIVRILMFFYRKAYDTYKQG